VSTTFKQSAPDAAGDSKAAFEAKFKSVTGETSHEASMKQDGTSTYELKTSIDVISCRLTPSSEIR